jgi:hypothetical protein
VLSRAGVAAAVLLPALTACGGSRSAASCLRGLKGVEAVTRTVGDQRFVRFSDGAVVGVVFRPSSDDAARLAPAANGPGDPFAYTAVGRAVLSWRGTASDPHLLAVAGCVR